MAAIEKRGNSYRIKCSMGYDCSGKQVFERMTWTPDTGMNQKQINKELNRQAVLFEERCKAGQVNTAVKFEQFAKQWFEEVAVLKLKQRTLANYHALEKRIYKAVGFMRMDKITPRHIQKFITDLSTGERADRYKHGKLAPKTIKNHVALISTIFEHAIKMGIVSNNPCRIVTFPKPTYKEQDVYSVEEAQTILNLLHREDEKNLHFTVYFTLAMFTGFRRGELLGLEWTDFDFDNLTISVNRTSNYTSKKGIFTDSPKTHNSYRTLRLPVEIIDLIKRYKVHQQKYIERIGDQWATQIKGLNDKLVDNNRLFTKWDGTPMFPNTPSLYYGRFCKRHGIRYLNFHKWRHFNATVQVFAGIDVKTVSMNLGHSAPMTTLNIYCKLFQAAQAASMDKIVSVIGLPPTVNV